MRFKYIIYPTLDENVGMKTCNKLRNLSSDERCCAYDDLIRRLKKRDDMKGVVESLQKHWNDHLNPRLYKH